MRIDLSEAVRHLQEGKVIAIPTETVYGLAARYDAPAAIEEIFSLKKRPPLNPLIIHLSRAAQVFSFTSTLPPGFLELAAHFWPGSMTLVVPVDTSTILPQIRAGLPTQAFRIPDHPLTRALLDQTGPLVAPSANLSGKPSAVCPEHVESDFGLDFPVLDGGICSKGVESTILIWDGEKWVLGRLGALPAPCFESILGYIPQEMGREKTPLCPGQLFRHYAPKATLHLGGDLAMVKTLIGFTDRIYPKDVRVLYWGKSTSPEEVLHNLYTLLRRLDEEGIEEATIDMQFPQEGLWITLLERLKKAASAA